MLRAAKRTLQILHRKLMVRTAVLNATNPKIADKSKIAAHAENGLTSLITPSEKRGAIYFDGSVQNALRGRRRVIQCHNQNESSMGSRQREIWWDSSVSVHGLSTRLEEKDLS